MILVLDRVDNAPETRCTRCVADQKSPGGAKEGEMARGPAEDDRLLQSMRDHARVVVWYRASTAERVRVWLCGKQRTASERRESGTKRVKCDSRLSTENTEPVRRSTEDRRAGVGREKTGEEEVQVQTATGRDSVRLERTRGPVWSINNASGARAPA